MRRLIFITYHPSSLVYHSIVRKAFPSDYPAHLVLIKHPYLKDIMIDQYKSFFDSILTLPEAFYSFNILPQFKKAREIQSSLRENLLVKFEPNDEAYVFTDGSAFLPVNIVLSLINKHSQCRRIYDYYSDKPAYRSAENKLKTWLANIYTKYFHLNSVYAYQNKKFTSYLYDKPLPACPVSIAYRQTPMQDPEELLSADILNINAGQMGEAKKNPGIILVIGGATVFKAFEHLFPDYQTYEERMKSFFLRLKKVYKNDKILYKPHPADNNQLMPGVKEAECGIIHEELTAEMIIERMSSDVKACYTVASSAVHFSALLGIHSYMIYPYLAPETNSIFGQTDIGKAAKSQTNKFLHLLNDLDEMGKYDVKS